MLALIVALYLVLMLGIGAWCSRKHIKGATDFLLAGRKLGLIMGAGALAATHFGGGALLGGAEYGYRYGASAIWYGVSTGIGLIALAFLTATKFRRLALFTVPDYLEHRYGGKVIRLLGTSLSLVALVGILASQINAAGRAFAILGFGGLTAPLIAVIVFITYTTLGGLWAATLSDLIQISIASLGVLVGAALVLWNSSVDGGFGVLLSNKGVEATYFSPVGEGPSFILWLLLPTVMYTLIGQDFYQRLFAVKSAAIAKIAALAAGCFLVVISIFPVIIGMGAHGLSSEVMSPAEALPWVLRELMHPAVGGFVLAAVLAAVMSTADSILTAATSHIVKDVWVETLHLSDGEDEKRLLRISRFVTVAIGLCALVIGMNLPGIVSTLIYSYTMYTAGVLVPVLGGVLWKGATRQGAICSVLVGSVVALVGLVSGFELWGVPTEIYSALVAAITFVLVSRGTA